MLSVSSFLIITGIFLIDDKPSENTKKVTLNYIDKPKAGPPTSTPTPTITRPKVTPTPTPEPTVTPEPTQKATPNPVEQAKDLIEYEAERSIREYKNTSIKEIQVNEHMGTDDPNDYIVLAHLKFDRENTAWGAKGILGVYADDLAANLADQKNVSEVTVFWEVPYLKNGANIAKFNYTRKGDKMNKVDKWYDPNIFN
ncbi:hypothetical protein M5W68_07280 [Paenibacillus larvae]|uniref:hypothetical protein n=1 Tax=Paenibacillus larvae TaxID=1464 RepID=UPI002281ADAC|nr:hypothetical protein [Paenibacillus larvae]MCY9509145.1 hypothetical protein [Paenibacillus larvae]MCY9524961.1 hypothetical protein [Paenibacillus larvae]